MGAWHQDRLANWRNGRNITHALRSGTADYRSEVVEKEEKLVKHGELAAAEMATKELDCAKKTACAIWCYSGTMINPLPGYD
jgi:hypothetical protein